MTADKTSMDSKTSTPAKRRRVRTGAPKAATKKPQAAALLNEGKPQVLQPELKKKELIDLVVEKSGVSKNYAKPVVEAMLEVLGENITEGRELNLHPLGKVKYNRTKDLPNARIVIMKLRQNKPTKPDALAAEEPGAE